MQLWQDHKDQERKCFLPLEQLPLQMTAFWQDQLLVTKLKDKTVKIYLIKSTIKEAIVSFQIFTWKLLIFQMIFWYCLKVCFYLTYLKISLWNYIWVSGIFTHAKVKHTTVCIKQQHLFCWIFGTSNHCTGGSLWLSTWTQVVLKL